MQDGVQSCHRALRIRKLSQNFEVVANGCRRGDPGLTCGIEILF